MARDPVDVVFFVEHKDREVEPLKRMAKALAEEGFSSAILSMHFHSHLAVHQHPAKIFAFPFVMSSDAWPVRLIKELYGDRVAYVNLNWEQLLSPVNQDYKRPRTPFQREGVLQLAWSDAFREYLEKHGVQPARIEVVGNVAHEILADQLAMRNEMRSLLARETGLDARKTWLFIPENYAWAFTTEHLIRTRIAAGYDPATAKVYFEFSKRNRRTFVEWISRHVEGREQLEVILRPHPSVTCEQWRDQFMEIAGRVPRNMTITRVRSVREWLPAVDGVLSSWSTVALEAHGIGTPSALLLPYGLPSWMTCGWERSMPHVTDEATLSAMLDDLVPLDAARSRALATRPSERHARVIAKLANSQIEPPRPSPSGVSALTALKLAKVVALETAHGIPPLRRAVPHRVRDDYFEPILVRPREASR